MSPRQRKESNLIFVSETMSDVWALDIALFASSTGFACICSVSVPAVEEATTALAPCAWEHDLRSGYITQALRCG